MNKIKDIEKKRTGGQIALKGFSYQLLYSIYVLLTFLDSKEKEVTLEGIEDLDTSEIDQIGKVIENDKIRIKHIQVKYSESSKSANFFNDILKNFLEVYLSDSSEKRSFELIYDMEVSNGNLKNLIEGKKREATKKHWEGIVEKIKKEKSHWNWEKYKYDEFFSCIEFKLMKKDELIEAIERALVKRANIIASNEKLFFNAIHYLCFTGMTKREKITLNKLNVIFQNVKDDIGKGGGNTAINWIEKIEFGNLVLSDQKNEYYAGKKATPSDIANNYPIQRKNLEKEIIDSVEKNKITIIKASSGQGKTTLAWQIAHKLKDDYCIYKLVKCSERDDLRPIVEYISSRIKIGEKPLIILDNLDFELKEWSNLAQLLEEKIVLNYKIIITTREDDWYKFSGNQSNLRSLKIIELTLNDIQAKEIYEVLKRENQLAPEIDSWQPYWELVSSKKLLIEYIYLLTHGEMLKNRVDNQMKTLSATKGAKIKFDILRKICVADIFGIKLSVKKTIGLYEEKYEYDLDLSEIIKSIENEFYIKIEGKEKYIEGLHPVRSQHIVDRLHEHIEINETIISLLEIVDEMHISKLCYHFPEYIKENKKEFYKNLVIKTKKFSYNYLINSLKGIYLGNALEYFKRNKEYFDDAFEHSGIELVIVESSPFDMREEFDTKVKPLKDLLEIFPENKNIKYLEELSKQIEKINILQSDVYFYAEFLFLELKDLEIKENLTDFVKIIDFLLKIDEAFNLAVILDYNKIWKEYNLWGIENIAKLMFFLFLESKEKYNKFIDENRKEIISKLKVATNSIELYESKDLTEINVRYLLMPTANLDANKESVLRLDIISKIFPYYEYYSSQAIIPSLDFFNYYNNSDSSQKKIPRRTMFIGQNAQFNNMWKTTILVHYEFKSLYDFLKYSKEYREKMIEFFEANIKVLEKKISGKILSDEQIKNFDFTRENFKKIITQKKYFPNEHEPFKNSFEESKINHEIEEVKKKISEYENSILSYTNQIIDFLKDKNQNLALHNLKNSVFLLVKFQSAIREIVKNNSDFLKEMDIFSKKEQLLLIHLISLNTYYFEKEKDEFYNKRRIILWYENREKELILNIKNNIIENNVFNLNFIFPEKIPKDKDLVFFPLGLKNFELTDENFEKLILSLSYLDKSKIDFVDIIFEKSFYGIRIAKSYLENISKIINGNKTFESLENEWYYRDFNLETINCLEGSSNWNFNRNEENKFDYSTIFLALWEYSEYSSYWNKTNSEERRHLSVFQKLKKLEIDNLIEDMIKRNLDMNPIGKKIDSLRYLILDDGYSYKNEELNSDLNNILSLEKEKIDLSNLE